MSHLSLILYAMKRGPVDLVPITVISCNNSMMSYIFCRYQTISEKEKQYEGFFGKN